MADATEGRGRDTIVFGIRWDGGKRPRTLRVWGAALLSALLVGLLPAATEASQDRGAALQRALVVPAAGHAAEARRLVAQLGGRAGRPVSIVGGFAARVPASAFARLSASPAIRIASPDVSLTVSSSGEDAAATAMQTADTAAGVTPLREAGIDGSGVGVALIDSGALPARGANQDGEFVGNQDEGAGQGVIIGPDFSSEGGNRKRAGVDGFGHGTHLAGVIAGHAGAFQGVAPGAHVVSVKVADANGRTSLLRVLAGLEWVRQAAVKSKLDIRVVNLSLGVDATEAGYVGDPLAFAAERLWDAGLVVVAAAGNDGVDAGMVDVPAADPFVIAVGALDTHRTADTSDDSVAGFSSRSATRPPDVVAPGTGIVSLRAPGSALDTRFPAARVGDRFFRGTGTSQATAVVSGIAALLLQQRPNLRPDQVKALLRSGAARVAAEGDAVAAQGAGAVNAARSAGLATPSASEATQAFPRAVLDRSLVKLDKALTRLLARMTGSTWSGSTWSGSTWSGSTWSGSTWSGSTWSGSTWSGSTWSGSTWSGSTWSGSTWSGSTWSGAGWGDE
jgi:serine protease AprX